MVHLLNTGLHCIVVSVALITGHAMRLTRYELSLLQKCETVDDCVAVNYGKCDCANGGGLYGINKDSVSDFEATFPDFAGCTEMGSVFPCDEGTLICTEERGLCEWQWAHAMPKPACQTSTERPTPSPDALTEEQLAPFRACIDDLQCEVVTNKAGYDQNMIGEEIAINSAQRKAFREAVNSATSASSTSFAV